MNFDSVYDFWFKEIKPSDWFRSSVEFDELVRTKFLLIHKMAISAELFEWRKSSVGCLCEIIVLDQFSRNIYRDKAEAFMYDSMALALSASFNSTLGLASICCHE